MLKKLLLIFFIGFYSFQSLALTDDKKVGLYFLGACSLLSAAVGGLFCWQKHEENAERDFWLKKTDDEMAMLVTKCINKIKRRLAFPLKQLRKIGNSDESHRIKSSLKCYYFIGRSIAKCDLWLYRLQSKFIPHLNQKIVDLKSELLELVDRLDIYIDKDFIVLLESIQKKQSSQPVYIPVYIPFSYS